MNEHDVPVLHRDHDETVGRKLSTNLTIRPLGTHKSMREYYEWPSPFWSLLQRGSNIRRNLAPMLTLSHQLKVTNLESSSK
jgi:hypothetical protein